MLGCLLGLSSGLSCKTLRHAPLFSRPPNPSLVRVPLYAAQWCGARLYDGDPRLLRALVVYGRSHELPTLEGRQPIMNHARFFLDVLYVHKKMPKGGNPENLVCQVAQRSLLHTFARRAPATPPETFKCPSLAPATHIYRHLLTKALHFLA